MEGNGGAGGIFLDQDLLGLQNIIDNLTLCWIFYLQSAAVLNQEHLLQSPIICIYTLIYVYIYKYIQNQSMGYLCILHIFLV